jgi:hypothetical protein
MDTKDIFYYDQESFSTLNKDEKHEFIKNFINNLAINLNNPGLIDIDQSPNENQIYHLYSDGTITRQKGSWAYGKRSIFDVRGECVSPNTYFTFPIESINNGETYTIMTEEHCEKVRDLINELLLQV